MNRNRFGYLALRGAVAIGILLVLGFVMTMAVALTALLWSVIAPVVELFGIASMVLVPLMCGIFYLGWNLARHLIAWVKRENNL